MANTFYPIAELENDILALAFAGVGGFSREALEGFIDETLSEYNKIEIPGYVWARPQDEFFYEQTVRKVPLNPMAQYVDWQSDPIPFGTEGAETFTGKIPRMKSVEIIDEEKAKNAAKLAKLLGAAAGAEASMDVLREKLAILFGSHVNAVTYQRMQMNSTGKFQIVEKNNKNGIRNITFDGHIPAGNIITKTSTARWWTAVSDGIYSSPGANANPVKDMMEVVRIAKLKGLARGHFEINTLFLDQVLEHPAVLSRIGMGLLPSGTSQQQIDAASIRTRAQRKALLEDAVGAKIQEFDHLVTVEKWNNTKKTLEREPFYAFENGVVSYVPDGVMGEFHTVTPYAIAGGQYARFLGGLGLLTIEADYTHKVQTCTTELTTIGLPKSPQWMWIIKPCVI